MLYLSYSLICTYKLCLSETKHFLPVLDTSMHKPPLSRDPNFYTPPAFSDKHATQDPSTAFDNTHAYAGGRSFSVLVKPGIHIYYVVRLAPNHSTMCHINTDSKNLKLSEEQWACARITFVVHVLYIMHTYTWYGPEYMIHREKC